MQDCVLHEYKCKQKEKARCLASRSRATLHSESSNRGEHHRYATTKHMHTKHASHNGWSSLNTPFPKYKHTSAKASNTRHPPGAPRQTSQLLLIPRRPILHPPTANLLIAHPPHRLQPLRQNRMRVVVARVEEIGVHGGQILDLELDERGGEFGGVAEAVGEGVYITHTI